MIIGGEPDSLLTECANSRRDAWLNATGIAALGNLKRLASTSESDLKERDDFFHRLETDEEFQNSVRNGFGRMIPDTFEKGSVPMQLPSYLDGMKKIDALTAVEQFIQVAS